MNKPKECEWEICTNTPNICLVLDDEEYWFCGDRHAEEFIKSIKDDY